jgi:hypothetical protein
MSHLIELIKAFVPHIPTQSERDEDYLNASVDACDVERRIAEIDHRNAHPLSQSNGLGGALH